MGGLLEFAVNDGGSRGTGTVVLWVVGCGGNGDSEGFSTGETRVKQAGPIALVYRLVVGGWILHRPESMDVIGVQDESHKPLGSAKSRKVVWKSGDVEGCQSCAGVRDQHPAQSDKFSVTSSDYYTGTKPAIRAIPRRLAPRASTLQTARIRVFE
jgi:hypothetical protein